MLIFLFNFQHHICNGASRRSALTRTRNHPSQIGFTSEPISRSMIQMNHLRKCRIPTELSLESKIQMTQPINTRQQHSASRQPISMPAQKAFEFKSRQSNAAAFYNTQPTNQRTAFGGGICYALSVPYPLPIYFSVWIGSCLGFT